MRAIQWQKIVRFKFRDGPRQRGRAGLSDLEADNRVIQALAITANNCLYADGETAIFPARDPRGIPALWTFKQISSTHAHSGF